MAKISLALCFHVIAIIVINFKLRPSYFGIFLKKKVKYLENFKSLIFNCDFPDSSALSKISRFFSAIFSEFRTDLQAVLVG